MKQLFTFLKKLGKKYRHIITNVKNLALLQYSVQDKWPWRQIMHQVREKPLCS